MLGHKQQGIQKGSVGRRIGRERTGCDPCAPFFEQTAEGRDLVRIGAHTVDPRIAHLLGHDGQTITKRRDRRIKRIHGRSFDHRVRVFFPELGDGLAHALCIRRTHIILGVGELHDLVAALYTAHRTVIRRIIDQNLLSAVLPAENRRTHDRTARTVDADMHIFHAGIGKCRQHGDRMPGHVRLLGSADTLAVPRAQPLGNAQIIA